jgi:hypothetical protein
MAERLLEAEDLAVGAVAAAVVTAELLLAGTVEAGSPWAPINAVAPLALSPDSAEHPGWDPAITPVGLGILLSGICAWAVLHRSVLRQFPKEMTAAPGAALAAGMLSGAALATFDYCILPPERRPRFERWLSLPWIAAKYGVLGAVLAWKAR